MKNTLHRIKRLAGALALLCGMAACNEDTTSDLRLDGDVWLTRFVVDGVYTGSIDRSARTVTVALPEVYDTDAMTVSELVVSDGARASVREGDVLNLSFPQVVTVVNGDVFMDYTVTVKHDEARILSFRVNDAYSGIIDHKNRTVVVRVPGSVDVTKLTPVVAVSPGATVTPASGQVTDFSQPVEYTVVYNTATTVYTVTVIKTDAPNAVYVGLADLMDDLNDEEKTAAAWMIENIPNAQYISFADVQAGRVDLSECRLMWWHLHVDGGIDSMDKFDAAARGAVDALVHVKELYMNGMNLLLTRFATYYAPRLGAALDGNHPNNCWGQSETTGEITAGPWNFFIQGHEAHPLYRDLVMLDGEASSVYTCDAGYRITNSTAQWHIGSDWGGYADTAVWRAAHGGVDLGYGGDGAVVVWEYPSDGVKGGIVCIGSGCYDWYAHEVDSSGDRYHGNVARMTQNAMDYLMQ